MTTDGDDDNDVDHGDNDNDAIDDNNDGDDGMQLTTHLTWGPE